MRPQLLKTEGAKKEEQGEVLAPSENLHQDNGHDITNEEGISLSTHMITEVNNERVYASSRGIFAQESSTEGL